MIEYEFVSLLLFFAPICFRLSAITAGRQRFVNTSTGLVHQFIHEMDHVPFLEKALGYTFLCLLSSFSNVLILYFS